eukprot:CAMPEP_0177163636 /NCGR_PEP_ID=MMETSP0367-20130122/6517_1 /TAXON_ID=447022 ORGANISM="Scrippsiella hangoei-like, Strain SHHI-4" /NCGR_SAMPLE_ID=MMETSP0367 /ASSEMBLY_ACC=CAM_ASM_000362 /LENGTH=136 /DNA_ID=CAMNT_0018609473 /DNA_START=28 /DNA_END=434 /DNA_ORIENTATION=-
MVNVSTKSLSLLMLDDLSDQGGLAPQLARAPHSSRSLVRHVGAFACQSAGGGVSRQHADMSPKQCDLSHSLVSGSAHGVSGNAKQIAATRLKSVLARFKSDRRILEPYSFQAGLLGFFFSRQGRVQARIFPTVRTP